MPESMPATGDTMHRANQRKIAHLMSAERDIASPATPNFRYLICSVPRSGSSLVSQMLTDTGIAGDPLEYLNPAYVRADLRQHPGMDVRPGMPVNGYLAAIERRRTTANGLFGIKLHHSHFSKYWTEAPDGGARFLRRFDRVLLIYRRDKAAQAVSYFRAQHSGSWSSLTDRFAAPDRGQAPEPAYDATALGEILSYLLARSMAGGNAWNSTASRMRRSPMRTSSRITKAGAGACWTSLASMAWKSASRLPVLTGRAERTARW